MLWIVWCIFPFLTWAGWIHDAIRTRRPAYLVFAVGYFLLLLPYFILSPPPGSDEEARKEFLESAEGNATMWLIFVGWVFGIAHALWMRKRVNFQIKYARMVTGEQDAKLERKTAAEYGIEPAEPASATASTPKPAPVRASAGQDDPLTGNRGPWAPTPKESFPFYRHCLGIARRSNDDPLAAAWCALWYILCAHRSKYTIWFGIQKDDFWQAMKDEAVANSQKAVDLLDKSSPHRRFAASLLAAAKALECKPEERIEVRAEVTPAVRHNIVDRASVRAAVTRDEFLEFAQRFKGHEWLTDSPLAAELPTRTGCLAMVALVALVAGLAAGSSITWLRPGNGASDNWPRPGLPRMAPLGNLGNTTVGSSTTGKISEKRGLML